MKYWLIGGENDLSFIIIILLFVFSQETELLTIVWHHWAAAKDQRVVVLEKLACTFFVRLY